MIGILSTYVTHQDNQCNVMATAGEMSNYGLHLYYKGTYTETNMKE